MKKAAIILMVFFTNAFLAQQDLFQKVKEQLKKEHPELNLENKLIMINIWSVNDAESRKSNVELNKAINTFGYARLKGGSKGIVGVVISTDENNNLEEITLGKDKIVKPLKIKKVNIDLSGISNVVFDSAGNQVYRGIEPTDIYSSIQKLITR